MTIVSKRGRPAPTPPPQRVELPTTSSPRIIINPDGSWTFPELANGNDEEVLRRTTKDVDINYVDFGDGV